MRWILMAVMMPCAACAEDWMRLTGRVVLYDGDHRQEFISEGRMLHDDSLGYWRVEGERYCSQWPPSDRWTCNGVASRGLDLRFVAADVSEAQGRYAELR
jgi:hypothetical protein